MTDELVIPEPIESKSTELIHLPKETIRKWHNLPYGTKFRVKNPIINDSVFMVCQPYKSGRAQYVCLDTGAAGHPIELINFAEPIMDQIEIVKFYIVKPLDDNVISVDQCVS